MEFNKDYAAIVLQRVFNRNDEYEQVDLVSRSDKRRTSIHRVILMAASEYFAGLLQNNESDEIPKELVLDSNSEAIRTVVDYCYTGNIDLTDQNGKDCLKIAVDGGIDLLLNKCHDYFSASLSTENVVDVLLTADKYKLNELQQSASELLCSHLEQVSATHIRQLNSTTMFHLMETVDETIPSELLVNRLLSWFEYDEAGRGEHMPKMLRLIRLEKLTSEFLDETIEPLFEQFKCVKLLNSEYKRRAMYYTPSSGCASARDFSGCASAKDENVATTDKTSVFLVSHKNHYDEITGLYGRQKFMVERFDESLNNFIPHFTSFTTMFEPILYENKILGIGEQTDDMIAYDMETGNVEKLLSMNERRRYHASIVMGKSIYVFGGLGSGYLSSCERYDMEKGTWQAIKSMNHKRCCASAAILNGLIYVVGGTQGFQFSDLVESYDPRTDEWTERMPLDEGRMQPPLVTFNGMLYAFLGGHEVREYDPVENVWTKIQSDEPFGRVISANGSLFAVTGGGIFGRMTINERKMDFVSIVGVKIPEFGSLHSMSI